MAAAAVPVPVLMTGNRRGGKVLVVDNFRYQKNKAVPNANRIYWRCCQRRCTATLITNIFNFQAPNPNIWVIRPPPPQQPQHCHQEEDILIGRGAFVAACLAAVHQDPSKPIKRIYDDVMRQQQRQQHIPPFEEIRSRLSRARSATCPLQPRRLQDVNIQGVWAESWNGNRRLLRLNNYLGVAIFTSDIELTALGQCQTIYLDGTFNTAPRPYTQILTIHGLYRSRVICLGMALMSGKTQRQYEFVLNRLKAKHLTLTGQNLNPTQVITDFEAGLMQAVQSQFPLTRRRACYFHYCQSLWRRLQTVGLSAQYRADNQLQKFVRKCMALGYLPLASVPRSFRRHCRNRAARRLLRLYPNLQQWVDYVDGVYLSGNMFPPITWNVYGRTMHTRTNNHVEGFHGRWNRTLGRPHPSIWTIIRRMKDEGRQAELMITRADQGDRPPKRRRKWRELAARVARLKAELRANTRTLAQYWDAVMYATHDYV